ncbi:hypothetical protein HOLleu_12115 [Holothuria leucospilota]|uniref:Uncharacterized protein n=1 Tax=Holothuria leucospilota TaxID=206669 RepID=A0A9Q1HCT8_HOLLE|nr:hypothetical protein HOLleu_12115 [Holothuria leucospilota]
MSRHARTNSASRDNRAFREAIANMRQQLLESQAEAQRMKDQLNCLIMLVRRAWSGDQAAAVHVANIVGVAPPTFHQEEGEVTALYKSKAIHHWAMLTVGLLNQHYRRLEEHALSLAKERLQQRQDYLEGQLKQHQNLLKNPPTVPMKSQQQAELQKPNFFLTSSSSSYQTEGGSSSTLLEYLYPGSDVQSTKMLLQAGRDDETSKKSKLFEIPADLDNKVKPKRPISAQHLKKADLQRSRPKSAVVKTAVKGDRPLKYETTRPVSAKTKTRPLSAKPSNSASSNVTSKSKSLPKEEAEEDYSLDINGEEDGKMEQLWRKGPMSMEDSVSEELRRITQMEKDFVQTTKMLQQKLGISNTGAI